MFALARWRDDALQPVLVVRLGRARSFKRDDFMAVAFLIGLALSNVRQCRLALVGILLSCGVVVWALISFVWFMFELRGLRKRAERDPLRVNKITEDKKIKAKPRVSARNPGRDFQSCCIQ